MHPKHLRYAPSHEWSRLEGDVCVIGITRFAVDQLTDLIHLELPDIGDAVSPGESFGEIESVKSVNDLYSSVAGEVIAVNAKVVNDPGLLSTDPYDKGWMIKIRVGPGTTLDHLLTSEQYEQQIASEEH